MTAQKHWSTQTLFVTVSGNEAYTCVHQNTTRAHFSPVTLSSLLLLACINDRAVLKQSQPLLFAVCDNIQPATSAFITDLPPQKKKNVPLQSILQWLKIRSSFVAKWDSDSEALVRNCPEGAFDCLKEIDLLQTAADAGTCIGTEESWHYHWSIVDQTLAKTC